MLDFELIDLYEAKQLEILKKYGMAAATTDFSILLGSVPSDIWYVKEDLTLKGRAGAWWTKTLFDMTDNACIVYPNGRHHWYDVGRRNMGVRPTIKYLDISRNATNKIINEFGVLEVEFGEYPQTVVSKEMSLELENAFLNNRLLKTGKCYTTDSHDANECLTEFSPREYIEYRRQGKKYIRVIGDKISKGYCLSDNNTIREGSIHWIEVEPIKWLVDESADVAISKKVLFAGIQFCKGYHSYHGDFLTTDIKKYMNEYFSKDIIPSKYVYVEGTPKDICYNPYDFDFSQVSEEEIIKGCVESNIAVMLHGRSGDGKSARVKELDPDAEILYLINASPDSLGGKSIVYNGEMIDIPPTWYIRLKEKCDKEKDKIHIVFFDEITNAPPSIQGMAFNIILDKEVNGKWKLPDNARIVAAGNELEESRSAYGMSEPLFNRFAHVYIETKVEDWLSWASTPSETYERLDYKETTLPMKIHPSIYAFIAYKSFKGEDALRSKFDGVKPNADPRKWELASKVLYETRKPEMLRSLVGEEITREFAMFCKQKVITVEDVLSENYTEEDLKMDTGEKYNTAVGLSRVSIEHFEKVRKFVKRLGPEICATFETLWAHGIEERLEKIQEIKLSERTK